MTLTDFQRELCATSRWDFSDLNALYVNCTLKPSPELSHTEGLMRISMAIMETNGVAVGYVRALDHELAPGVWPDMREHGAEEGRLACLVRAGAGSGHPGSRLPDLARREVVGLHARDRAPVRELEHPERARAVRVLRQGRRLPDHRERGRHQALLDEHPLLAPASRVHDPAAGRRRLDRRGRPRPFVSRCRLGRPGERLHEPEHDVHDLEPAAHWPGS